MNQPDPYGDWDAAYVLGALTVQQRHEYEDHLAGCAECRQSVGDLAAMPGLLAQLPAAEAIALSDHTAADGAPLPESIRDLTPPRRTSPRTWLLLVAAVVLALIIGGIGGFVVRGAVPVHAPGRSSVLVAFAPNNPTDMIANAKLTSSGSGTRIHVDCMYALNGPYAHPVSYALVTVDDQGNRHRGGTWVADPGDRRVWTEWAAIPLGRIRSLQIVYANSGAPVMTAPVG